MSYRNSQSSTEVAQKNDCAISQEPQKIRINPTRAHESYWKKRLAQRAYDHGGETHTISDYQVRLKVGDKQVWFNTKSSNKENASRKALEIYVHLCTHGAEATLRKYKEGNRTQGANGATIGEFLDDVLANSDLKAGTFEVYAKKFRSLVAGVCEIDGSAAKYDYVHGGNKEWLKRVREVSLAKLTPEAVNKWKVAKVKAASGNPLDLRRANITLRSIMLSSKSLFSGKIRKHLGVTLPQRLWFEGVALPKRERSRYKSEINPATLMLCAKRELADGEVTSGAELSQRKNSKFWWLTDKEGRQRSTKLRFSDPKETAKAQKLLAEENAKPVPAQPQPELYKIFLLAFGVGLRRGEIDKLEWRNLLWHENKIRVEVTEHGDVKSDDSEGDVAVDPDTMAEMKRYLPKPGKGSPFVIQSDVAPRTGGRSKHYRCNRLFKKLSKWLAGKGISARCKVHTLRKECGSQVYAAHGIVEAQKVMRHADLNITREHYISGNAKTAVFSPLALLKQTELQAAK